MALFFASTREIRKTTASFAAADGGVASSWALTLVAAAAFGVFSLKLYSKADGAEAGPLLAKAT